MFEEELSAEDIVVRHLASIGQPEIVQGRESYALQGTCRYRILSGGGKADLSGTAQLVSSGSSLNFIVNFGGGNYNGEQFVTDGNKATTAHSVPGTRYPLAEFLYAQKAILTEGLFGGVMTTAWPLLELTRKEPRLRSRGLEKVSGEELYELEYRMRRGGGDLRIRLYFSPDNFRHVLTTYEMSITAQLGASPIESARQRTSRYKLEERFEEFKDFEGLTLPSRWVIQFSQQETKNASLHEWAVEFAQSGYNQQIPDKFFSVN
jgi:hypothetical protein